MFRSDPSERTDSTLPTTGTGTGVLQHLSGWETGDPSDPHRNRRPVPLLGYESFGEMGCTHRRGPAGEAARRFCAAVPAEDRSRSCGRHPQGSRTRPPPGRPLRKARTMPPSGTEAAMGKSVQFLSERPTLGTHVCSPMSLLSFSARVCLNQHHWLALRMQQEGIVFWQCKNAFLQCSDPERLQARKIWHTTGTPATATTVS